MSSLSSSAGAPPYKDHKMQSVEQLVLVLYDLNLRENALLKLFKSVVLRPKNGRDDTRLIPPRQEDPITRMCLQQLLLNVNGNRVALLAGAFDRML
ncbi:hypothetical protein H5410_015640 [Solanum commersonii]|uniref:Uncharacterized protein n=1 Tax=Solanum commersonii TaxID=4109 RepID=A0A9J5ZUE7_SOLCO|nr:hypothetical protein H5410_015640 [Solanum commersonii]